MRILFLIILFFIFLANCYALSVSPSTLDINEGVEKEFYVLNDNEEGREYNIESDLDINFYPDKTFRLDAGERKTIKIKLNSFGEGSVYIKELFDDNGIGVEPVLVLKINPDKDSLEDLTGMSVYENDYKKSGFKILIIGLIVVIVLVLLEGFIKRRHKLSAKNL